MVKFNHDFSSRFRILKGGKVSLVVSALLVGGMLQTAHASFTNINVNSSGSSNPDNFKVFNNKLYFNATNGTSGKELMSYDGTTVSLVKDFNSMGDATFNNYAINGSYMYIPAFNGSEWGLWKYDGTNQPTQIATPGLTIDNYCRPFAFNNKIYFVAQDGTNGREIRVLDPSNDSITLLSDMKSGSSDSYAGNFTTDGTNLYFMASTPSPTLWKHDGTNAPSQVNITGVTLGSMQGAMIAYNGSIYLNGYVNSAWKMVKINLTTGAGEVISGVSSPFSEYGKRIIYNNELYFVAGDDATSGQEKLFKYDGTTLTRVTNLNSGASDAVNYLTELDGKLYFTAADTNSNGEIWQYDGTNLTQYEGVVGTSGSIVRYITPYNGKLYFYAYIGADADLYTMALPAAPTLTTVSNISGALNGVEKEITLDNLKALANEADSDGTVDAFVVKAVSSGTLKIGTDSASATAFDASTNNTIDATKKAYWTADSSGVNIDAFTVVAKDNGGTESTTPVQVKADVSVTVFDAEVTTSSPTFEVNATLHGGVGAYPDSALLGGVEGCDILEGRHRFSAQSFIATSTTDRTISTTALNGFGSDNFMAVYEGVFDENNITKGLIGCNDDKDYDNDDYTAEFTTNLESGKSYTMIFTAYSDVSLGDDATTGTGSFSVSPNVSLAYSIGGTVSGLVDGESLTLSSTGLVDENITTNSSFIFDTPLANGDDFNITVTVNNPAVQNRICTVTNGTSTISNGNIDNISVVCSDIVAPNISQAPAITGTVKETTASFTATANEASTGYWVALPANATAPSAAQIAAGQDSTDANTSIKGNSAMSAGNSTTFNISGLSDNTEYKVYFVAKDSAGNVSSVSELALTTPPFYHFTTSTTAADSSCWTGNVFESNATCATTTIEDIEARLQTGNVTIKATGDLNITAPISWGANSLELQSGKNIHIAANLNASGTAGLVVKAGYDGSTYDATKGLFYVDMDENHSFKGKVNLTDTSTLNINGNVYTVIRDLTALTNYRSSYTGNGYYALGTDITMSGDAPAASHWVAEAFNGLGHKISGYTSTNGSNGVGKYVGFFRDIRGGEVSNLAIVDAVISGDYGLSIIAPNTDSAAGKTIRLYNIFTSGTVTETVTTNSDTQAGAITSSINAYNGAFYIENVHSSANVSGSDRIGGLFGTVGCSSSGAINTMKNISSSGNVSGSNNTMALGGLSSMLSMQNNVTLNLSDAKFTGTLSGASVAGAVGGITGTLSGGASGINNFTNVESNATIHGFNQVGGIVGKSSVSINTISNATFTGTITTPDNATNIGGIVGYAYTGTTISSSTFDGNISANTGSTKVGGIVGYKYANVTSNSVKKVVSVNGVSASQEVGASPIYMGTIIGQQVGGTNTGNTPPNSAPTAITLSLTSVDENVESNTTIAILSTTDTDEGDTHTFSLVSGEGDTNNGSFEISGSDLKIKISPNYELKSSYNIRLKVTDSAGASYENNVTINITDVNEPATATNMAAIVGPASVNTFDTFIPTFSDPEGDNPTQLKITSLPSVGKFEVLSNGIWSEITSANLPLIIDMTNLANYRFNSSGVTNVASTTVEWSVYTDGGWSNSTTGVVTIVSSENNQAPDVNVTMGSNSISDTIVTINEDSVSSPIIVTFSDDYTPAQFLVGVVDSNNSALVALTDMNITRINDNNVSVIITPKANMYGDVNITLGAFDGDQNGTKSFVLRVNPVNDLPTDINITNLAIRENNELNATIGTLGTTDIDTTDTHTYSLDCGTSNDNDKFLIDGNTLKARERFDFETKSSYSICVRTTDSGSATYDKNMTIGITNENEAISGSCGTSNGVAFASTPTTNLCASGDASNVTFGNSAFSWNCAGTTVGSDFGTSEQCSASLQSYTVTINNGDTNTTSSVIHGETFNTTPTKEGYTFAGWYTDASFETTFDSRNPITANTILYPKWIANSNNSVTMSVNTMAHGVREVTLLTTQGLTIADATNNATQTTAGKVKLPFGTFAFNISGGATGFTAPMSIVVDKDVGSFTYYKQNNGGKWVNLTKKITFLPDDKVQIDFDLTDGGVFDRDGSANGTIVDPGGVATNALNPYVIEGTTLVGDASFVEDPSLFVGTLSYTITGGANSGLFEIDSTNGELSFKNAPVYNTTASNNYFVEVTASGSTSGKEIRAIMVTVLNADGDNEISPVGVAESCGTSARQNFVIAPTAGLCQSGIASAVSTTTDMFTWSCNTGEESATPINCSAKKVNESVITNNSTITEQQTNVTDGILTTITTGTNSIEATKFTTGNAKTEHIAKANGSELSKATSFVEGTQITVKPTGDVETSVEMISETNESVSIKIEGKVSGDDKAIHTLNVGGKETKASSKITGTTTEIKADGEVETKATVSGNEAKATALPNGTATHIITVGTIESKATIEIAGAQTVIDNGGITTSVDDTQGGITVKSIVKTDTQGESQTWFEDSNGQQLERTVSAHTPLESGAEVNVSKDTNSGKLQFKIKTKVTRDLIIE